MATNYSELMNKIRGTFNSSRTLSIQWRLEQTRNLVQLLDKEEERLCDALWKDLRKCKTEAIGYEIKFVRNECINVLNELENWVAPERVGKTMVTVADTAYIRSEPLGVVLVMGAWNYPVQLVLLPMLGALAAGNCVVLKPSEIAENTAKLMEELIPKYMDKDCVQLVNGGIPETTALLKERFDKIFYTGCSPVGKIVMEAAAKHLTPVTLELGGKSPVYVDPSSDLKIVARRVAWGKYANAGQTCVAPDYILCRDSLQDQLVTELKAAITEFYGENPKDSPDLGRIINDRHFQRVKALIEKSGTIAHGGRTDQQDRYIEPTILTNVKPTDPIMQEEIFGPVLPIVNIEGVEDAIQFIRNREKPLVIHVFSQNDQVTDTFIGNTFSGGLLVNDTLIMGAIPSLPFGGVGNSGMGAYHGKHTFDCFSHRRACMIRPQAMESINTLRYPPFSTDKLKWLLWAMQTRPKLIKGPYAWLVPYVLYGLLFAIMFKLLGLEEYIDLD